LNARSKRKTYHFVPVQRIAALKYTKEAKLGIAELGELACRKRVA